MGWKADDGTGRGKGVMMTEDGGGRTTGQDTRNAKNPGPPLSASFSSASSVEASAFPCCCMGVMSHQATTHPGVPPYLFYRH